MKEEFNTDSFGADTESMPTIVLVEDNRICRIAEERLLTKPASEMKS
jgi:hypothetical protein